MMVMAVIRGILAVLVMTKFFRRSDQAREIATKQDIEGLMQALKVYLLDNQRYPATEQGLQALLTQPTAAPFPANWKAGGYIKCLPKDQWGNPYQYLNPGVRGEIDIFSLGADDRSGSEDNDTDIRLLLSHD